MKKKPKKRATGAVPSADGFAYVVPWNPPERPPRKPRDPRTHEQRWARIDAMTARAT